MTLRLNTDDKPSLLLPTRMDVFSTTTKGKGKRAKVIGFGYQAWNTDPIMEQRMARLPGSGSFYWPNALMAYVAAKRLMRNDASIHQIKIETISGREIARMFQETNNV